MHYIKTSKRGDRIEYEIENGQPRIYVNGEAGGTIWKCLNMDADGNQKAPQMVDDKPLAAYAKWRDKMVWLFEEEAAPVLATATKARAEKDVADKAAWDTSEAGKTEAERARKEREWDALYNEGGDGYNPYRREQPAGGPFDPRERHYPDGA